MHLRIIVITALIGSLVALSNVTAQSRLEGRVSFSSKPSVADRYVESEEHLQEIYDKLFVLLEDEGKNKLRTSQTAWKRFKVAECDFSTSYSAVNAIHPLSYTECQTTMNIDRMTTLENEYEWRNHLAPEYGNR